MSAGDAPTGDLGRYVAATHRNFRLGAERAGGRAVNRAGLLLLAGPHPGATILNATFRTDPSVPAEGVLDAARGFYERGAHFGLFTSDDRDADLQRAAEAAGWHRVISLTGMVLRGDLSGVRDVTGARVRPVDPDHDRDSFTAIATPTFADDDVERAAYPIVFDHPAFYEPPCGAVLAEVDGRPAACAWFAASDGVATIGFVATLSEYRRRGLGTLVTAAACRIARSRGADLVTLQASPTGFPVYERMGFETITYEVLWGAPV